MCTEPTDLSYSLSVSVHLQLSLQACVWVKVQPAALLLLALLQVSLLLAALCCLTSTSHVRRRPVETVCVLFSLHKHRFTAHTFIYELCIVEHNPAFCTNEECRCCNLGGLCLVSFFDQMSLYLMKIVSFTSSCV